MENNGGIMMFTEEDLDCCWPHYKSYFIEVLNGEFPIDDARKALRGLVGSKYDTRVRISNNGK